MISLFQPEVASLDAQLEALQAQIAAIQEQRVVLNKAESVAAGIVQAVRGGVEEFTKISGISGDAIARLKSAVLDIFGDDDNPDDDNGNHPNPEPQPSDDGGCGINSQPNQENSSDDVSAVTAESETEAIAVNSEVSPEVPQPEPQSEPEQLASDFQKEVQARGIQTICSSDGTPKFDLIWTRLSDRVATYSSPENPYNWEHGFVSYLGFATKEVASAWQQHLLKIGVATKCIIRKVNRLKVDAPKGVRIRWEMKCHGLSESQLQNILNFDLTQPPVIEAKACESEDNISDSDIALIKFQSGDRIKVIEPGHPDKDEFGTVKRLVMVDGVVAVELDSTPIERLYPPHFIKPLKVEDLESAAPIGVNYADDPAVADVPTTDWKAEAKKLGLSLDNISPGHYLAYHKYRKLGEVIEKHDAINSYYVNRNQCTMLSVGNGDGQKYSNPHEAAIGLAKFLKVIVEPEEAKADLNGSYSEPFPAPQTLQTWREIETDQQKQIDVAPTEQPIEANDWVELLVNGDRYQVDSVDAEGIHLVTDDGNMLAQPDEVKLLFRVPAGWKPF